MNEPSFLQSPEWAQVQVRAHHPVIQVGDSWQGFRHTLFPGFSYGYFPRVPGVDGAVFEHIVESLSTEGGMFARIEPVGVLSIPQKFAVLPTACRQPQHTLLLDLQLTEELLLERMHQKTRYNIRLAERHGVIVKEEKNSEVFVRLMKETGTRDGFRTHPDWYYRLLIDCPIIHQYTAWYEGKPLAVLLLVSYRGTATYLHGASTSQARDVMAPYALQWQAIRSAKAHACTQYDFWGIAPPATTDGDQFHTLSWQKNHAWSGVTRFKVGFGGTRLSYPDAFDIILQKTKYQWYSRIRALKKFL